MGVTPSSSEVQPARATPATRNAEAAAKPETRSKFEEAMRRMREGGPHDHELAGGEGVTPLDPPLQRHPQGGKDRDGGDPMHGQSGHAPAQPMAAPVETAAAAGNAADIASSHHEFLSRINLPNQSAGAETQLTMTDQRWIASHAVVRRDEAGGLSVDIQARSDADSEEQRQALRARLEARGHRVTAIEFDRS